MHRKFMVEKGACKYVQLALPGYPDFCITHNRYVFDCLYCGREYHTTRIHSKWCSDACRQAAYRQRKMERSAEI